jgi:hypothetical protein
VTHWNEICERWLASNGQSGDKAMPESEGWRNAFKADVIDNVGDGLRIPPVPAMMAGDPRGALTAQGGQSTKSNVTRRERFWARLGFRECPVPHATIRRPEQGWDWDEDNWIRSQIDVALTWRGRLLVLLSGHVQVKMLQRTENRPGTARSWSVSSVVAPGRRP